MKVRAKVRVRVGAWVKVSVAGQQRKKGGGGGDMAAKENTRSYLTPHLSPPEIEERF